MSLDTFPDPPQWARDAGIPEPREAESFREFYGRCGIDEETIEACFDGLDWRKAENANQRMATILQRRTPQIFERHVAGRLSVHRR